MVTRKLHYYATLDQRTMWYIRLGIFVAMLVMIASVVAVWFFAIKKAYANDRETEARIKYQETLIENVGKPQIIEQRYYSQNEK